MAISEIYLGRTWYGRSGFTKYDDNQFLTGNFLRQRKIPVLMYKKQLSDSKFHVLLFNFITLRPFFVVF